MSLKKLNLYHTPVTDTGVSSLSQLTKLKVLWISANDISDVSLSHLCKLPSLEVLDITRTNITDMGLDLLASMESLHTLYCRGCSCLTMAGINNFQCKTQSKFPVLQNFKRFSDDDFPPGIYMG